jgi:dynein heavy chain
MIWNKDFSLFKVSYFNSDTLDSWMKLQRSWKYLEPIFISDDIKKKMPLEYKKFESVDKSYRVIIESVAHNSNLWDNIDSDKMKNDFD